MAEQELAQANDRLKAALEKAESDYETNLDNLIDAATQAIEDAYDPETGSWKDGSDPRDIIREFTDKAGELSNTYYNIQRGLWEEYAGLDLPEFDHTAPVEADRVLWQQMKGFSNSDFNGLTYKQVKVGQSKAGMTIEDLWPDLSNLDDVQQLIADMMVTSTRLTAQRNMRIDPSQPRWARVCHGAEPCAFCVMLASRGYAYLSKETAQLGGGFHDGHCHCTVSVSWGGDDTLLDKQREWKAMYDAAVAKAGSDNDTNAIMVAMNHLYPDKLRGGVYELSQPWPDDVLHVSGRLWRHIIDGDPTGKGGHAAWATIKDKTHFPDDWDVEKIKWAVNETIAAPDSDEPGARPNSRQMTKTIEGVKVLVRLTRRKNGWRVSTAFPDVDDKRGVNT